MHVHLAAQQVDCRGSREERELVTQAAFDGIHAVDDDAANVVVMMVVVVMLIMMVMMVVVMMMGVMMMMMLERKEKGRTRTHAL